MDIYVKDLSTAERLPSMATRIVAEAKPRLIASAVSMDPSYLNTRPEAPSSMPCSS